MGYQLWYSKSTNVRRNGTRIKEIEENLLSKFSIDMIYEPLLSVSSHVDTGAAFELMTQRDFDLIGIKNHEDENIGYIHKNDILANNTLSIRQFNDVPIVHLAENINVLFNHFKTYEYIFIKNESVTGIVMPADFNKPICRIYIFSVVSMLEMHLNFWISQHHKTSAWGELLSPTRIEETRKLFNLRKGNNEALSLLECTQLCDKKTILLNTREFLKMFDFSKTQFKDLLEKTEKIRNDVAHSQNSIIANVGIKALCDLVHNMLAFIRSSDDKLENLPK